MTVEIVVSWERLIGLAHTLGQARLHGTPEQIADAEHAHDAYRDLCLQADRMILPVTVGGMS